MTIDHVTLVLTGTAGSNGEETAATTRKSLRRTWNQLPRCQRNLIILGVMAICVTLLFFLPGEPIVAESGKDIGGVGGAFPFNGGRDIGQDNAGLGVVRHKLDEFNLLGDELAAVPQKTVHQFKQVHKDEVNVVIQEEPDNHLENIGKISETVKSAAAAASADAAKKDNTNIHIEEINMNTNNHIEAPIGEKPEEYGLDRAALELAVQEPLNLPGSNGIKIDDYVDRLQIATTIDAQKQHFHGATNERQTAVVDAFRHSWNGYRKYAWGYDNLKPISQAGHDWFGLGLTLIDSLDTMYIMGLEDEFAEARDWVNEHVKFDVSRDVNLFEVTIRVLGGLLASYHLSGDKMFLKKSLELGNRLLPCFLSPSGIPYSDVNLGKMSAHSPKWSPDSSTSEVTTIQLEFRDLSRSTNIPMYEKVIDIVNEKVHGLEKNHGLVPIFINANTGTFRNYATISLGARGDSYYEYLLKQWLQTGRKENDVLILDYMRSVDGILTQLMRRTPKEQHVYVGELINGKDFKPKMDHLTCYLPGTLILGHKYGMPDSHMLLAKDLLETCYQTYMKQPTHLAPEISHFAINDNDEQEIYVKPNDAHNLLRPEFVESLYYFYALTGNRTYQDMGWNIFQAFEKHTKVAAGYTSIGNVKNVLNTRLRDMMESFWLGETLKYFYLLFSDNRNEVNLDKWIFNTEAHPLPVRKL